MKYLANTPDQLSKILRARRRSLELTQQEAGKLVGLLPKTVSALENRSENNSVETLFKYLLALYFEMKLRPKELPPNTEKRPEW